MKKIFVSLFVLALFLLASGYWAKTKMQAAGQAYIYGYPLLLVEATKEIMLQRKSATLNQFRHLQFFPDHSFRNVVRPNNDTLYSIAWLDLSQEPIVLGVPDTDGRYYVMPLMDAATNVFATVGKLSTGTQAGSYLIHGPEWVGDAPAGITKIPAPTNLVWIIGRIQTNDPADIDDLEVAMALQEQFTLSSVVGFREGVIKDSLITREYDDQSLTKVDPSRQIENLSGFEFLTGLGRLLSTTHIPEQDADAIANLNMLGVSKEKGFDSTNTNAIELWLFNKGMQIAKQRLSDALASRTYDENGWIAFREGLGRYGTDYNTRAGVAKIGLGALPPEEAAYPNSKYDSDKQLLSGKHRYEIHFEAGKLPPADAFWSLAMYDEDGFFIQSSINRYSIGDRNNLSFNDDGSLTLLIQNEPPIDRVENWLPSPAGEFAVTLRLYMPRKEFLDGSWLLPPINRVSN